MHKTILLLVSLLIIIGCEEVVIVDLPPGEELVVVEAWITNSQSFQEVSLNYSNSFSSSDLTPPITDAQVFLISSRNPGYSFIHQNNGRYISNEVFSANGPSNYVLQINLENGELIISNLEKALPAPRILFSQILSFEENDPENPSNNITVHYPKIFAQDSSGIDNYYRWRLFKNNTILTEPEFITIQNDKFFDGNLIPNSFETFRYNLGDTVIVELQSISEDAYNYLSLLKSQISTLGTSSGTTPSRVDGNLSYIQESSKNVLGFFGVVAVDRDTLYVE